MSGVSDEEQAARSLGDGCGAQNVLFYGAAFGLVRFLFAMERCEGGKEERAVGQDVGGSGDV